MASVRALSPQSVMGRVVETKREWVSASRTGPEGVWAIPRVKGCLGSSIP
jgi:hypothetical protein